ncbi:MAG: hypothetical protein QM778_10865 [Myxococcales bacterium]
MSQAQRTKIQSLLSADESPLRDDLLTLTFDAITAQPLSVLLSDPGLAPLIFKALTADNAERIAERHVLPIIARVDAAFAGKPERLKDGLGEEGEKQLRAIVASGKGPRLGWLKGAVDPDDIRQLVAPVVQQVLIQFASKLPIPGLGGVGGGSGGGAGGGSGLGGLVGMIGKQVQKSAGQLAEAGKTVMNSVARDFSQTAITEFRTALGVRMKSDEGQKIVLRIRERVVDRVIAGKLSDVIADFRHLPEHEIAGVVAKVLDHLPKQAWFRAIIENEVAEALKIVGGQSLAELLREAGLLDEARALTVRAVAPGVKTLAASDAFGSWLDKLLAESATP